MKPALPPRCWEVRYARRRDRLLALVWPAKRRQLRMARALLDGPEGEALQRRIERSLADLRLYGTSFSDPGGSRIDPATIGPST